MTDFLERRAARDTHLRGEKRTAPDAHAVRDLDEIVDLRPRADPGFADRRTIDRRIGADLHVVLDDDIADLRDLVVAAVGVAGEAETVAADDRAVLHDDAVAEHARVPEWRRARGSRSRRRCRVTADDDVRVHDRARADACPSPTTAKAPMDASLAMCAAGADERQRMDASRGTGGFSARISTALANARYGFFVRSMAHGAASACSPRITAPARVARSAASVLVVGEEREVGRAGALDTRDARDVELAVPFEPAAETLGKSVKLHESAMCF